jgi:hypothetical protein
MELITTEYSGRAWPAAVSVGRVQKVIGLKASGKGKAYKAETAQAWWRNFAELNLDSEADVVGFVQRHGDPFDELGKAGFADTSRWAEIQEPLKTAAAYWSPEIPRPGGYGISTGTTPERRKAALSALAYSEWFNAKVRFEPAFDGVDFTFRAVAGSLAAYMVLSALIQVKSKVSMSACLNCADWYEVQRLGSKFCTPSCRAIYSKNKKGTSHGND